MKPKIIFLTDMPYVEGAYKNYAFDEDFARDGFKFEYWSICDIFGLQHILRANAPHVTYFKTSKDLCTALQNEMPGFICIVQIPYMSNMLQILRTVTKTAKKCIRLEYVQGALEFEEYKRTTKNRIKEILQIKEIPNKVITKLFLYYMKYSKLEQKITTFYVSKRANNPKMSLNHLDVELFNAIKDKPTLYPPNSYIVFVDIGFTNHVDLTIKKIKTIEKEVYLSKMNSFFDVLEKKFNQEVVIASHPKANYKDADYNGRKIVYNKTNELVKNASFAIYHLSSSISFAILSDKPMVYVYMNDFYKDTPFFKRLMGSINNHATYFESPFINIDDPNDFEKLDNLSYSKVKYEKYKSDFMFSIDDSTTNYQKILNFIEN